jgi:hypothetical protein
VPTATTVFPAIAKVLSIEVAICKDFSWIPGTRRVLVDRNKLQSAHFRRLMVSGTVSLLVQQSLSSSGEQSDAALLNSYASLLNASVSDGVLASDLVSSCNCTVDVATIGLKKVERKVPTRVPSALPTTVLSPHSTHAPSLLPSQQVEYIS